MAKIADQFKGLPIGELIANPLIAAAQAQGKLAGVTEQFIEEVGLEKDGEKLKARTVEFGYDVPVQNPKTGDVSVEKRNLKLSLAFHSCLLLFFSTVVPVKHLLPWRGASEYVPPRRLW